jgi:D-alanine-D-alanine ligase
MLVGLTYDLREEYIAQGFSEEETAEFDRPDTIEAIEKNLNILGYQTERIGNIKNLAILLVNGKRWDIVFNICEGMYGISREAQVPALLDAYNIPYVFSNALVLSLTLHKGLTKQIIRDSNINTPDFNIIYNQKDIKKIDLDFPLFAKPVAEGTGKGINEKSVIKNKKELEQICISLLEKYKQPVLIETYLPGREFTVGIVGTGDEAKVVGIIEIILKNNAEKNVYSYLNKEECETLVDYVYVEGDIAEQCKELALKSYKSLGCEDAARIDIRCDKNSIPNFIEINPLAGLHPEHSDLPILCKINGIEYNTLIKMIMDSAIKKIKNK